MPERILEPRAGWEAGLRNGCGLGMTVTIRPFRFLLWLGPWALTYGRPLND